MLTGRAEILEEAKRPPVHIHFLAKLREAYAMARELSERAAREVFGRRAVEPIVAAATAGAAVGELTPEEKYEK